jgi:hypothetical protein
MRWFKHLTIANRDESLNQLIDEFGLEGYGAYWLIVELIAEKITPKMTEENQIFLKLSEKNWRKFLGFSPKKFQKFLGFSQKFELFLQKSDEKNPDLISLYCPKLLKYRDEYTRKKIKNPESLRSNSIPISGVTPEQDTEYIDTEYIDTDKDLNIPQKKNFAVDKQEKTIPEKPEIHADDPEPTFYLTRKKKKLSGTKLEAFNKFWEKFNYKKDRASAADAWLVMPEHSDDLYNKIFIAAERAANERPNLIATNGTPKMAQGWISARRWEDEIQRRKKTTAEMSQDEYVRYASGEEIYHDI